MPSMNQVFIAGHLGKDALVSFTPTGKSVTKFSVATTRKWKDERNEWKEETTWLNVVVWGKDWLGPKLLRGVGVMVKGRLSVSNYQNKDGQKVWRTEIVAEDCMIVEGKEKDETAPRQSAPQEPRPHEDAISDDDVPF